MESDVNGHDIDRSVLTFVIADSSSARFKLTREMHGVNRKHSMYSDIRLVGKEWEAAMLVASIQPDSTNRQYPVVTAIASLEPITSYHQRFKMKTDQKMQYQ